MNTRQRVFALLVYVALTVCALVFILPLVIMFMGSLKPDALVLVEAGSISAFAPHNMSLQNYQDVFERVPFSRYLFNSVLITTSIVITGLLVNSLAGYALARMQWPGRNTLLMVIIAILIIPLEAIAVPLFYEVTLLGWNNTYLVQIVPFIANAFSIYLFYSFFLNLPKELEEKSDQARWLSSTRTAGYVCIRNA